MKPLMIAFAILTLSGCEAAQCVSSSDCFRGEVCVDDQCVDEAEPMDMGSNPEDVRSGANMSVTGDAGARADISVADMLTRDMANSAADLGQPDVSSTAACVVDPFDTCEDDEDSNNNSFPGASFTSTTRGCQPTFVPMDETISGRQCALDPEDLFGFLVVECDADEPGMIIEATLTVKDDCDPALIWFDVEQIGTSCAEPNPDSDKTLRCETLGTGQRKISVIWPGAERAAVAGIKFSIQTPDRTDVQFDYDLNIVVREP